MLAKTVAFDAYLTDRCVTTGSCTTQRAAVSLGGVRFLLVDPRSKQSKRLAPLRRGDLIALLDAPDCAFVVGVPARALRVDTGEYLCDLSDFAFVTAKRVLAGLLGEDTSDVAAEAAAG